MGKLHKKTQQSHVWLLSQPSHAIVVKFLRAKIRNKYELRATNQEKISLVLKIVSVQQLATLRAEDLVAMDGIPAVVAMICPFLFLFVRFVVRVHGVIVQCFFLRFTMQAAKPVA